MFENGIQNLKRIILISIFSFLFLYKIPGFSDIKLRFKEIEVRFEPIKKSHTDYASKIVNYLNKILIKAGNSDKYFMSIIVKKYDVIVRKEKNERDLIDIFKRENRVYLHKVSILVEVSDLSGNEVDSIPIETSAVLIVEENLPFNQRKIINKNLYNELKIKLTAELKKNLLTRLGDFVIPI